MVKAISANVMRSPDVVHDYCVADGGSKANCSSVGRFVATVAGGGCFCGY